MDLRPENDEPKKKPHDDFRTISDPTSRLTLNPIRKQNHMAQQKLYILRESENQLILGVSPKP